MNVEDDIRQLDDLRRRLEAAENAFDAEPLVGALADDAVIMVPDFPVQEGKAACAAFVREVTAWQHANLHRHITYVSAEIRVLGEAAFDRGTFWFSVSTKAGGKTMRVNGKYFFLYARDGAGWKISRAIVNVDRDDEDEEEQPYVH